MNKSDAAGVSPSDLTPFLYAGVGVETSNMELTVLSALARQGLDPWREAERLASLPRSAAVNELARAFSAARLPESAMLADRLVALLPHGSKAAAKPVAGKEVRQPSMKWMVAAMAAGLLSSFIFAGTPKPADTVAPASWFTENVPAKPGSPTLNGIRNGADGAASGPVQGTGDLTPVGNGGAPPA